MSISFFAKPPSIFRKDCHTLCGSSIIRGQQIAEYLGEKFNPTSGYASGDIIIVRDGNTSVVSLPR